MEITYDGYYRIKDPVSGKKHYNPTIRCGLRKRRSRRWFPAARMAKAHGEAWAARASKQISEPAAEVK